MMKQVITAIIAFVSGLALGLGVMMGLFVWGD
jgi:hypothetical protein